MQSTIKRSIAAYIEENKDAYHGLSKAIWERPELGMEEYEAHRLHTEFLKERGFRVESPVADMPTAYVATYGEGHPVIGFSAEYDALPGLSQKATPHTDPVRQGAPGHGCGHNLLGVAALLAACSLQEAMRAQNLPGTIKIFGTPAEELCIGKPFMGSRGVFDGVDVVLDWHPWSSSAVHYSTCPAYFNVKYHFKGRTAHGNSPWHGRSALDAAILQAHAIEMLREHYPPGPSAFAAHTINYTFSDTGPEFASVVPDRATLWCIGRFSTAELVGEIIGRVDKCAEGAALATDTTVAKEYIAASHEMIANETVSRVLYENLVAAGDVAFSEEEKAFVAEMQREEGQTPFWSGEIPAPAHVAMAVTDAAEYSWVAPYGILTLNLGPGPSWHNRMVTACAGSGHGEKTMDKAGLILACAAADFLENGELLQKAKEEWAGKMKGRSYGSLLPAGAVPPLNINKSTMDKYR
ncbi:MAG: amidohydrolase [Clostridiales Family XIII bacterium]|jgi:aminobenzoyl-glutamate utilization protein B|nr:amidohydrolase [Clostridiales Family XIII bacterium]